MPEDDRPAHRPTRSKPGSAQAGEARAQRAAGERSSPNQLWGGRFESATDPAVERFTASVHFDQALARHDIRLSLAHARMLRHHLLQR
jgi:hypothetical protein